MTANRRPPSQVPPDHRVHDVVLIAAWAAGDADPGEAARAEAQAAGCTECRTLAADLAALAAATRALPAPRRAHDFRLTPVIAARLRPRSPILRLLDGLVGPGGFGRPLAATLVTLGFAGLLVATLPSWTPFGASTGAPANEAAQQSSGSSNAAQDFSAGSGAIVPAAGAAAPSPGTNGSFGDTSKQATQPSVLPAPSAPGIALPEASTGGPVSSGGTIPASQAPGGPAASDGRGAAPSPLGTTSGGTAGAEGGPSSAGSGATPTANPQAARDASSTGASGPSSLAVLSAAFMIAGLAIFTARRIAGRIGPRPLA